ncbi:alpha/beta fold hydrolase [Taklimakanibacter lacteus]|uniref:alpha/beta fold hydrolase n=1 Tax=Taklimakanibacter lacteus TaxID=2268456 RepID=UPI000E671842
MSKIVMHLFVILAGLLPLAASLPAVAKPVSPLDIFYTVRPEDLVGPPGTLIRAAPMQIGSIYRAKAWRILYVSQNLKGEKIGVSGMAMVSTFPNNGVPRPVVAWAHATTGVARKCAPSLRSDPLAIPGAKDMIVKGYTLVATDYPGLGAAGQVPYLIGTGEAQAVLDSVKAIRFLPEAEASNRYVLWGHSQGGHAALFAAVLASSHAADLALLGVAAAAPATSLGALLDDDINTIAGRILAAMTLLSWSRSFGFPLDGLLNDNTLKIVQHIDKHCVDDLGGKLAALSAEQDLGSKFLNYDPGSRQPWRGLLASNTPVGSGIGAPILIAQGGQDSLVQPRVTADFVRALCRSGKSVSYLTMPQVDHGMIADKSAGAVVSWMESRFKGAHPTGNCGK